MLTMRRPAGFTIIELIMVIAITGIIAAALVVFFTPAVDAYFASQRRADLTDIADTALRRMRRDVQLAVPNSIRVPDSTGCFEMVPAAAGGRVRMGPDISNPGSAWLDTSQGISSLDVLSTLTTQPSANDWVVIGNQNGNDLYKTSTASPTRAQLASVSAPTNPAFGTLRLNFNSSMAFPSGYSGGRMSVVAYNGGNPAVVYICSGAGTSNGTGTGTLYRLTRPFVETYPTSCPSTSGAAILATLVSSCTFSYSPTTGSTQQNGYMWMQLQLKKDNETVTLSFGAHVDNVP